MTAGRFIAFEGGEGTGKSTQARLLQDALDARGIQCALTREPGGTPGAEAIRGLLLNPPGEGWNPRAEALLFAAARSDHVERLVRPKLAAGQWVVSDRFLDSSRAYQGVAGEAGDDLVRQLHQAGSQGMLPDLTIIISVPDEISAKRLEARDRGDADAIGGRAADYHRQVNQAFLDFAKAEPGRFAIVDGEGPVEDVHARVLQAVAPLLDEAT